MADPVSATLAIVSTLAAVGGTVVSQRRAREAQREQREQNAISNAQQRIARQRSIRQSIARSRVIAAEQEQAGFQTGFAGGAPAVQSDVASAIGAARTQQAAAEGISASQARVSSLANRPNFFNQLAGVTGGLSGINFNQTFAEV